MLALLYSTVQNFTLCISSCSPYCSIYKHLFSLWSYYIKTNWKAQLDSSGLSKAIMKPQTAFKADPGSWFLLWITLQLEGCTSWSRTASLQHGHALLSQHHLHPERSKVKNLTKSHRGAHLSLGKKAEENRGHGSSREQHCFPHCFPKAWPFKMQPAAKWLMKVWLRAFCLTPATEPQPRWAAAPKRNVMTQED